MTTRDQAGVFDRPELLQSRELLQSSELLWSPELLRIAEQMADADASQVLAALATVQRLRAHLDQWEATLITAARGRDLGAARTALGLASRQAAERRYLRLRPQALRRPSPGVGLEPGRPGW